MSPVQITPVADNSTSREMSRLSLLYEVAEQVNSTLELNECLDHIIDGAYRIFQAEKVSLMLIEEGTAEMRIAAARNVPPDVMANARVAVGSGLAGKVALSGEPLVVSDVEDDPRFRRKSKEQYQTASFAIIPLRIKDRVIGVLNLTNRADGAPFSQDDLALLAALTNQAAIAIENSRLIAQLNKEKESLRRSAFESTILYQVSSSIQYGLGYQHLIRLLSASLHKLVEYDVLCSLLILRGDEDFEIRATREVPPGCVEGVKRMLLDHLGSRPRSALVSNRIAALKNELAAEADAGATRSAVGVPLEIGGQAIGMIFVTSCRDNAFSPEETDLLHTIVQRMAETVQCLQNTIRGEQDKMESMVASMAEGVVMFDANDELVVLNPKARSMLGLSPSEEFTTQSLSNSVMWKEIGAFLATPLEEEGVFKEFTVDSHPDPQTLIVALAPVKDDRNTRLGRLAVIRDVTLQRELDRMKSDFVAVVSHELRTPLSSIKMFISNLLDGVEGEMAPGQKETLSRVSKNVDRLSRLINDLLDLSKLEAGKMKLRVQPIKVRQTLETAVGIFTPGAETKDIQLSLDAPDDLPVLWADPDRIEQVLTNLLGNALKFTPQGGRITVKAHSRPPAPGEQLGAPGRPSPISGEGHILLSVSDTGAGIPEHDLERIFDKFYQADRSMTRQTGGTGLGLPICREIIAKHGGHIWAESQLDRGSTFTCELPVDCRAHDRAPLLAALEREIRRSQRYAVPFSALMIDIDDFSLLNEDRGYDKGDTALIQCHEMVKEEVKKFLKKRIRETDIVGRFGGDEFLVIAPETEEAGAHAFAERLRKLVENHNFALEGKEMRITVSAGVAAFSPEDHAPLAMIRRAAAALTDAKGAGKNRVC